MARTSKARQELHERMTTVFRTYQRAVDALDELATGLMGVNRTDARVLDLLEQNGRMTAGDIAAGAGITTGAVSGVIDRLERAGYARRVRDEEDRRKVMVEPTDELFEQTRRLYFRMPPKGEKRMAEYSDDEMRLVIDILRKVTSITEEHATDLRENLPPG